MISTRSNVFIAPYKYSWSGGPHPKQVPPSARVMKGGKFIDSFPRDLVDKPEPRLRDGRYLYGGPLKVHFGHLIVDSIIRLWAFRPEIHEKVIFPRLLESKKPNDWMFEIIGLFGVERSHVLQVETRSRFQAVDFAAPGARLAMKPHPEYLEFLETLPLLRSEGTPEKVYFGRSHIASKGTMLGETYFARHLEKAGFAYVAPENHSIHEQTSLLRNAKQVVFMEGSSIYSLDLLPSINAPVYMIPRRPGSIDLFSPHVGSRTSFTVLGDPEKLHRIKTEAGVFKPTSPSVHSTPDMLHADMVAKGLISGPFNEKEYREAEEIDALAWAKGDQEKANSIIAQNRSTLRIAV